MAKADTGSLSGLGGEDGSGAGGDTGSVNPANYSAPSDSGASASDTGKPKRHRRTKAELERDGYAKPASGATRSQAGPPLSVNSVQFSLTGIHALLAVGLSAPELKLEDEEAKTVSENIVAVARHYDLQQTQKATDIGNLVMSLVIVYGGRLVRISARKKIERNANRAKAAGFAAVEQATGQPAAPTVRVNHPVVAGKPTGAMPVTRPKTEADQALLNEVEQYIG
jgi:hypothetical protein